jgi:CheY-specific phosphatase CheX
MKSSNNSVTKRALLVEKVGGPLSNLTPTIQQSGCDVARAAEPRAAVTLVRSLRRLSFVAVNGDIVGTDAAWLVTSIKALHPDLPILWFSSDSKATSGLPKKIEFITDDLKKLEARISRLVREEFYSPAFVQQIISCARTVFGEFALPTQASEACVKSSHTCLGEVNTFLLFSGVGLAGHIILSTSIGDLSPAYRVQFPRAQFPGLDDLEDLLGEIANQIMGQLKRYIHSDGSDCRMGLPYFIRGVDAGIRHKAGAPSLAIEFGSDKQKVQLELCMHRFGSGRISKADNEEHMKAGSINFL